MRFITIHRRGAAASSRSRKEAGLATKQEQELDEQTPYTDLVEHTPKINQQLARYGVKFGIYKDGTFNERLFPFDAIPRVIEASTWKSLEAGLIQRVRTLNLYLADVYGNRQIIADGVVPEDFAFASSGYLPQCEGITPPGGIYSHISGIDLVEGQDGTWYVLEDNLRIPSGASYPLIARGLCRRCDAGTFRTTPIVDNRDYGTRLKAVMDNVNTGGANVILTPGATMPPISSTHTFRRRRTRSSQSPKSSLWKTRRSSTATPGATCASAPSTAAFPTSTSTRCVSARTASSAFRTS